MESVTNAWGAHGTRAVARLEHKRRSRHPTSHVLLDVRQRTGGTARGSGKDGGGTYQAGLFGEEVVADRLVAAGWRLLGHRVRTRVGELDLVARRGDTIVFAEVKTGHPGRLGIEETIDGRARHRLRRAAIAWMSANPRLQHRVRRYRFDVFIVRLDKDGVVERVDHYEDAF